MFSIYGWIEIWLTPDGDEELAEADAAVRHVRQAVVELGHGRGLDVDVVTRNGLTSVRVHLAHNRESSYLEDCRRLLEEIARLAPGSYGILFVRETDTPIQTMHRFVMRRGEIVFEEDDIFTPVVPTIEAP